ncbi:MAG TPA: hypothetical protein VEA37_04180 [Flavobacterium sp.]|nr:hypothetical protein [Flavobacterium sp.]
MDLNVFLGYAFNIFVISAITAAISFGIIKVWNEKMSDTVILIIGTVCTISLAVVLISLYFLTPAWTVENPF